MIHRTLKALLLVCGSVLLASCVATGPYPGVPILGASAPPPYKGPLAAPQVAYRIDENRYFEIVPREDAACYRAGIFYTDKALGIHTLVMGIHQLGGVDLVIDAANTQYLVAPMIKGGGSCYTCGGSWLPYSTDGGRTWKQKIANSAYEPLTVSKSTAYVTFKAGGERMVSSIDLSKESTVLKDWKDEPDGFSPKIEKAPIDTKFRCVPNGTE